MAKLSMDDVTDGLRAHLVEMEERRREYLAYRAAYRSRFWRDSSMLNASWAGEDGFSDEQGKLCVKVEVNQVWSFITSHVANLMYRGPKVTATLPAVTDASSGRYREVKGLPEQVGAACNDWLSRSYIRPQSTDAYRLALMYDSSAFKLWLKPGKGDIVSRIRVQALPRWEAVWDPFAASREQMAYVGHLRHERLDVARELLGNPLTDVQPEALQDYLAETSGRSQAYRGYVRIFEVYDLLSMEQRFYLVSGTGSGAALEQVGATAPMPYTLPGGEPGAPIIPVVLSSTPEHPMQGISAVRRIYHLNAEQNLLMSVVASAMRRDASRVYLYLKGKGIDEAVLNKLMDPKDLELIGLDVDADIVDIGTIIQALKSPAMPQSLGDYAAFLDRARQDVQASSDLQQGRQGQYLTATEATYLASYGEQANNDLQARMQDAISEAMALFLTMAAEGGKDLSVRIGKERHKLDADTLKLPWQLSLSDSASTPLREQQKKTEFMTIRPALIETMAIAGWPDTIEGPSGEVPNPHPQIGVVTDEIRSAARTMVNYMQQLWQLPEGLSWTQLALTGAGGAADDDETKGKAVLDKLLRQTDGNLPPLPADMNEAFPAPGAGPTEEG